MSHSARSIINGKKSGGAGNFKPTTISQRIPHSNMAAMTISSSRNTLIKKDKEPKSTIIPVKVPASAKGCEEVIKWTPASEFLKSENGSRKFEKPENGQSPGEISMRREPSYIRLSRVLNGYINNGYPKGGPCSGSRSKTPDPHAGRRSYESPLNRKVLANGSTPKYITSRMLKNGQELLSSNGNGFTIDPRLENCSSYCFKLPDFAMDPNLDGEGYKKLVEDVLKLLKTHLEKTTTLLQNQDLLPEEVSESVRVAVGRTELLLKKRMAQFTKQLHSHLNPTTAEKLTTLNDLHGLWTLVDIQLADIRSCFEQVEKSRLIGWQTPRQTLTTAASMPSLLLPPPSSRRPSTENGQKVLLPKPLGLKIVDNAANKEKEIQRKAIMEAKRQELNRQRRALIDAKRAELNNQKEVNKE